MWWAIVAIREVGAFPRPFPEGCGSRVGNGGGWEAPPRLIRSSFVIFFLFRGSDATKIGSDSLLGILRDLILPPRQRIVHRERVEGEREREEEEEGGR